jgi:hypothetical protein
MRSFLLLALTILFFFKASSQSLISSYLKQKEILVPYYEMAAAGSRVLYLPIDYGKSTFSFEQIEAIKNLKNAIIARIDLVYSDYPAKADFTDLTKKRFESLQKIFPKAFLDKGIDFRKIRQTIGATKDVASGLQHGFFIYFREKPTKASGKKDVAKLKLELKDTGIDTSGVDDSSGTFWCSQTMIVLDTLLEGVNRVPEGYTRKITKISTKASIARDHIDPEEDFSSWPDSVYYITDERDGGCDGTDYFFYTEQDTTVTQVFKRHNWSHSLVIADVTGSMYPYAGQLLKWVKLNLTGNIKKYFLFFNDGDEKEDDKKILGKTGGIYPVFTNEYDEVEKVLIKAMENGSGGDAPENNIEALLESDKFCSDCDSIIMIADNWAPVKDLSLLTSYHKPVKVVLCGVFDKINKDYLKLARDTKGSIHLIEEDIYTLSELKEGERIKIHGITYQLVKGDFVDATPVSL